jgi:SH3 domain protein
MHKKRYWNFSCAKNNIKIVINRQLTQKLPVKKIFSAFFILTLTFGSTQAETVYKTQAQAETIYVGDDLNLSLRSSPSTHGKVLKSLSTGTPLTLIDKSGKSGFIHVRLTDGTEGYIKLRYTKKQPPVIDPKDSAAQALAKLQSDNIVLKTELSAIKDLTPGSAMEKSIITERDLLARELSELKKTAASSIQLKNERDELQERVVNVERELQQYKLENQALKGTASQDWFLYGGLLSLIGVLLGFILPKIGWQRKNNWDSY